MHHRCMSEITVDDVFNAAVGLFNEIDGKVGEDAPGIMADLGPRQHQHDSWWRNEHPARTLRVRQREARDPEAEMAEQDASDQDHRQADRAARTMPGQIEDNRHGDGGAEFQQDGRVGELTEGGKLQAMAGDHPDGAEQDQAAGRAEEATNHGIGHIADRPAEPAQPKSAQHEPGCDAGKAERD